MINNGNEKIKIIGGNELRGEINISGAKNSALPIIIAGILSEGAVKLSNVPNLMDIHIACEILSQLNVKCERNNNSMTIDSSQINQFTSSYDLANKMRASILILGPLLTKYGKAKVPLPGGCSIGARPVDLHIDALKKMGAIIEIENGNIVASAPHGLNGADISFNKPSVGVTENILMAASLAKGKTKIINAACEPEIIDLANMLNKMGAKIIGHGTKLIEIDGVSQLSGVEHNIIGDRIEAGSYALATIATGGHIVLKNISLDIFGDFVDVFEKTGNEIYSIGENAIEVKSKGILNAVDITTEPYPGFPTDLQSPWMAALCLAKGKSFIRETIFENRFTHVPELIKMGANIVVEDNHSAIIYGVDYLQGANVSATDLRASFALIIAGLVARGETTMDTLHHMDRGYVSLVENLSSLGANIKRGVF